MDSLQLAGDIRQFIAAEYLFGCDGTLTDSASFLEEGILDSTGVLRLIAYLEETYGIKVKDDEVVPENLDSIDNLTAYLSRKLNGAAAVTHAGAVETV